MTLRIAGGRVYDPANGVAGEVRDVCLSDGKVVDDVPAHAERIGAHDERRIGLAARKHRRRAQLARVRARVPAREAHG